MENPQSIQYYQIVLIIDRLFINNKFMMDQTTNMKNNHDSLILSYFVVSRKHYKIIYY